MIFEIADGEQRRNSATADGRCPILTAFKTNSWRTAVTFRTCVGERNISNGRLAFTPLASRSNSDTGSPDTSLEKDARYGGDGN